MSNTEGKGRLASSDAAAAAVAPATKSVPVDEPAEAAVPAETAAATEPTGDAPPAAVAAGAESAGTGPAGAGPAVAEPVAEASVATPAADDDLAAAADETNELDFSDTDSAVGSLSYSSLTSLTDSIREFRYENGRTYHSLSAGKYWCPNDDPENNRLEIQHHAHRLTFEGALCCCPKAAGAKRVLDLGTGTGIWAMEYADEHPEAEVIGVDLSPIQPEFVPPNCSFEVDDIEKEWTWSKKFDFIWWRALLGCFADVQSMVQKCFDNLEPGGYLEMHDGTFPPRCDDNTMPADCSLLRLTTLATEASARLGRPIDVAPKYKTMMEEAGFVDVVFELYKWPTNGWPRDKKAKTLGLWTLANVEGGLEGLFLALLTRGLAMTAEETIVLCAEARKDLRNTNMHAYWPAYYCYGRKPE